MSALLSGLGGGGEQEYGIGTGEGRGGLVLGSSSSRELADIGAILETATAALEEIRNQVESMLCVVFPRPPAVDYFI